MKVWEIQQEYHQRNSKVNSASLVDSRKFNYLESIKSKTETREPFDIKINKDTY